MCVLLGGLAKMCGPYPFGRPSPQDGQCRRRLGLRREECIEGLVASRNGADVDGSLGRRRELDGADRGESRPFLGVKLLSCEAFRGDEML